MTVMVLGTNKLLTFSLYMCYYGKEVNYNDVTTCNSEGRVLYLSRWSGSSVVELQLELYNSPLLVHFIIDVCS